MNNKELYEQKIQAQLNLWKAEKDKLSAKLLDANADARLKLEKERETLNDKINKGKEELAKIQAAGA